MSANFAGVTFAEQKVTPSADAIIRRAILSDGVLTGCDLSYSGSTLTMSAGYLMVCGRQIRHPAAQNWAVVDATSGYARLLLTIDLTRTSTKDAFDQVVDTIEYASSVNGFPELTQADINDAGTKYQIVLCTVSLGTGGISGIVSQLGKSAGGGAGGSYGSLNFSVVGGLTQPADPSENTIWVITNAEITGYAFSATAPGSPYEGQVWIQTGSQSTVAFSIVEENPIYVYPIFCNQYISGAWVHKTAKSYQNGEWVDWWDGYLYNAGDLYENIIGGWEFHALQNENGTGNPGTPTITYNSDNINIVCDNANGYQSGVFCTKNKISLANADALVFDGLLYGQQVFLSVWSDIGQYTTSNLITETEITNSTRGKVSLDVSSLPGFYYVGFRFYVDMDYPNLTMYSLKSE